MLSCWRGFQAYHLLQKPVFNGLCQRIRRWGNEVTLDHTEELAEKRIVRIQHSVYYIALNCFSFVQVPKHYTDNMAAAKCTIVISDAFSAEIQKKQLDSL